MTAPPIGPRPGYISWHRDSANGATEAAWPFPFARAVKAAIYLHDVAADGAPLTLVPGARGRGRRWAPLRRVDPVDSVGDPPHGVYEAASG
jgi:hypothetical protein